MDGWEAGSLQRGPRTADATNRRLPCDGRGQLRGGRARRLLRPAAAEAVYLISSFASPPPLTTTDETTTQAAATAVQGARSLVQLIPIATPFAERERARERDKRPSRFHSSIHPSTPNATNRTAHLCTHAGRLSCWRSVAAPRLWRLAMGSRQQPRAAAFPRA